MTLEVAHLLWTLSSLYSDDLLHRNFFDKAHEGIERNEFDLGTIVPHDVSIGRDDEDHCMNFQTIMAGILVAKTSRFSFDMSRVLSGFIRLVEDRIHVKSPLTFTDDEPITLWNAPCIAGQRTHANGWGTNPYGYGFDERFLKHVLYYAVGADRVKFILEEQNLYTKEEMSQFILQT